jgi:hypothetical protein
MTKGGQPVEVVGIVNPGELVTTCGGAVHQLEIGTEVQVVDAGHHRIDPSRLFGMANSVMLDRIAWFADDQHAGGSFG